MEEVRILAPNGMVGTNYPESSLKAGLAWKPHVICVDAGSTDSGPGDLGNGTCRFPRDAFKRDLKHMLIGARSLKVPMIVGSCGGAGAKGNLDWTKEIVLEIAREEGLSFKLATIYSDQDRAYLKSKLAAGAVSELGGVAPLSAETIDRAENIVGMMGCEPIIAALENGAEVILAGRASDTALFAAYPTWKGLNPGPVWHAAKILECGAAAVEYRPAPDCLFAWIRDDHFEVRAPNPDLRCTAVSVAAHALYENGDPYLITEPGGVIDLNGARYEEDDGAVKVHGSAFRKSNQYTVKLEAAEFVGYQSVTIGGIADPNILEDVPGFLAGARERTGDRIRNSYPDLDEKDWTLAYRVYGLGETVMGTGVTEAPGRDIGVVVEVTATTQQLANGLLSIARHQLLHQPVPHWKGFVSNYALAHGASPLVRGKVFRFSTNSVVKVDDPHEMFNLYYETV